MRLGKWTSALIYVAFLALCAEVVLQGYYRLTAGAFLFTRAAQSVWAPDPHSGFFNRANLAMEHRTNEFQATYFTNSRGLRVPRPGVEYPLGRSPDRRRVLLLGPSFAFGWAVDYEESFAAELERLLAERGFGQGRRVEVVNAGVNSLGTAAQLRWLEAVGVEYQPDLIVQFVYGSMVVDPNPVSDAVANEDGYLVPRNSSLSHRLREQAKKSALVFYGWVIYTRALAARADGRSGTQVLGAGRPLEMQSNFDPADEKVAASIAFFDRLRDVAQAAGSELLVVYFPLSYAVHPQDIERWRHLGVHDVEAQKAFDATFCAYLKSHGVPCTDITPSLLEAAASGERLYYWLDVHWTPEGNRVAARAVADRLLPPRGARGRADPGILSGPRSAAPAPRRRPRRRGPRSRPS